MILLNMAKGLGALIMLTGALLACLALAIADRLGGGTERLERRSELAGAGFPAETAAVAGAGAAIAGQR